MSSLSDIWQLPLCVGSSDHPSQGACAMDAVSWLVYGTLGDNPACVCPVITEYVIKMNDAFNNDERQKLCNYLLRFIDTVDPDSVEDRQLFLLNHCVNKLLPLMIDIMIIPSSIRFQRKSVETLKAFFRTWKCPPLPMHVLMVNVPNLTLIGIPNAIQKQLSRLLPQIGNVFLHAPLLLLPDYLMTIVECDQRGNRLLTSEIVAVMWQGLEGLLQIGRRAPENYLDQPTIIHANESFKEAAKLPPLTESDLVEGVMFANPD